MPLKKTKKRKKASRMHGRGQGTHGWGARKKHKKSGHRGGKGMAGTGKRADQKKTLVTKLYGHGYFGKRGITSKRTWEDKRHRINLEDVELNIESFVKRGIAKKTEKGIEIDLSDYKILDSSKEYALKNKLIIKAKEASKSAIEKIRRTGGEILLLKKKVEINDGN
ncbi:MAG TPA: uL15 family ribosomal protein [Candidatus Nanoarchaeia archaeon]|uniref:Large ribosomal subunit protein uL15 n=1 Tax=uncultured archaeon Rifle_16ft_4_minimus_37913 TaxID=1665152 RepID=A0A0H4T9Y0_9ARCH|nr:50S ribosomal protein L15P [uncultured archaeon]AKQ03292.1 50S ribosomal protein L15, large subunit ribosomal protein L15 [uncultured archaeon Rifle_16ft_4_minimus_37913]HKZ33988.1 uL15 family ribosomal protein [Candidatus Nanoarchaeia archaeon]